MGPVEFACGRLNHSPRQGAASKMSVDAFSWKLLLDDAPVSQRPRDERPIQHSKALHFPPLPDFRGLMKMDRDSRQAKVKIRDFRDPAAHPVPLLNQRRAAVEHRLRR